MVVMVLGGVLLPKEEHEHEQWYDGNIDDNRGWWTRTTIDIIVTNRECEDIIHGEHHPCG